MIFKPQSTHASAHRGGLSWVLGLLSMGSSVVHLFYPDQLHGALPPYVPFSFMLIGMVGFFQSMAGLGLLLPPLRRPAGWLLTLVVIVAFPANAHLFFDVRTRRLGGRDLSLTLMAGWWAQAFYNAETWRFVLMALWTACQFVLIVMIYIASAPWTRPHRKEVHWSPST
jgi:uncharacterized membrane protein